ncbi:MAG: hypothetical protein ACM3RP_07250 [Chitinophagales bacterium]
MMKRAAHRCLPVFVGWLVLSALAGTLAGAAASAGGPYTIRGLVLGVDGRPVSGYPVRLTPLLPEGGPDAYNLFYHIAQHDDHLTHTDERGRFTLTGVTGAPEVAHHLYALWSGYAPDDGRDAHPYLRVEGRLDLAALRGPEVFVVLRAEPAAALKLIARDAKGRPFTGTVSLSLASGGRALNYTAHFQDGVHLSPGLPPGNPREPGRVLLLSEPAAEETQRKALALGQGIGSNRLLAAGAFVDRRVQFLPFQTVTLEVTVPWDNPASPSELTGASG